MTNANMCQACIQMGMTCCDAHSLQERVQMMTMQSMRLENTVERRERKVCAMRRHKGSLSTQKQPKNTVCQNVIGKQIGWLMH